MLSSQTKDAQVAQAMGRLKESKGGLTADNVNGMDEETLKSLIYGVGFHNNKTKFIKKVASICVEEHGGDIPETVEGLCSLPGVGPKMAYIVMSVAWDKVVGVGIDTHMHRIFNKLSWVSTKNPTKTQEQLESWLPRKYWKDINELWVGFGQEVQQEKEKSLKKALSSSRPRDALQLMKKCGLDYAKEGKRYGMEEEIKAAMTKAKD